MSSRKFNSAELLELPSNGENKEHRRIFHEFDCSLLNCLNYRVIEGRRNVGQYFMSSVYTSTLLVKQAELIEQFGLFVFHSKHSELAQDLRQTSINLCASAGSSVNFPFVHESFCQHFVLVQDLRQTSVNFWASVGPFVNFLCFRRAFHQLSVWQRDFSSSFNNFPCIYSTFHQLPSTYRAPAGSTINNLHGGRTYRQHQLTFRASAGLTINLRQRFVKPGDLLSTFRLAG